MPLWGLFAPDTIGDVDRFLTAQTGTAESEIDEMVKAAGAAAEDICALVRDAREAEAKQREIKALESEAEMLRDLVDAHGGRIQAAKEAITEANEQTRANDDAIKARLHGQAKRLDRCFRPPADLVLLVNPASEAIAAQQLINALCQLRSAGAVWEILPQGADVRRPWILSIKSKADWSTRLLFPRAMQLQGTRLRHGQQGRAARPGCGRRERRWRRLRLLARSLDAG